MNALYGEKELVAIKTFLEAHQNAHVFDLN